ncbi:Transcriptional activator HAP2 [Candida viswanathii]|uniref:Transcriptional activator HAP2 n=1 Tax=Candida viswanathii TaxID=5486 RepID=A0A367XQJ4_9ASCO|nr:Transcriptional activator HAP2 [Candida viswanathii]
MTSLENPSAAAAARRILRRDSPTSTYTYDVDQEYHQQAPGYDQQQQQEAQLQQGVVDGADEEDGAATEQPFYVNAKQYHRILKRRIARAKLEENLKIARTRKPYLHESRHKHAMRRPRGQGGRFLTAAEIAELEKSKKEQQENESGIKLDDEEGDKSSRNGKGNGNGDVSGNPWRWERTV